MSQFNLEGKKPQAWLLLDFGEQRNYAGNTGYKDETSKRYQYDNNVPNSRQISEGDLVLLRSKAQLLGVARIQTIEKSQGKKELLRCPECEKTKLNRRKTKECEFRCYICKYEFDTPKKETVSCEIFTANFGNSFVPAEGAVGVKALQKACLNFNKQLSIQLIDLEQIEITLLKNAPAVLKLLNQNSHLEYLQRDDADKNDDNSNTIVYCPTESDRRQLIMQQIRERRGQSEFRQALRSRYGDRCMITGCEIIDILEAAHISPYRGDEDNHPENGLLLRADLHTLFDLDLLGICPKNLKLFFHPKIKIAGYKEWHCKKLLCSTSLKPSKLALQKRWIKFYKRYYSDL
ncbi:MAG: HNH endonuclease [Calothrix sp. FI2-JRJ7]|jgi:ribosomal protein L37AE/L43A|nr:HNH endonuclease [Calothrix sp. FI2-JRJ7]